MPLTAVTKEGYAMNTLYSNTKIMLFVCGTVLGMISLPSSAADTVTTQIQTTVTAECSLSLPATIDLGIIPYTVIQGKSVGDELTDYAKDFTITTVCHGTNSYSLVFVPGRTHNDCLLDNTVGMGGMGFCFYNGDTKIMLGNNSSRETKGEGASTNIKVTPLLTTLSPLIGEHTASLTISISPL